MIKIIKEGQKDFITQCPVRGCEFSYQVADIEFKVVTCPWCGGSIPCKFTLQEDNEEDSEPFKVLQIIQDLCIDYDGFNTVEGLKSLIDDIREIAEEIVCKEKKELS